MKRPLSLSLCALLVTLSACGSGGAPEQSPPTTSASASAPTRPAYIVVSIDAGDRPCAVEGGFGSVWVSLYGEGRELRLDPQTGKVIARIKTGASPCGVAVGGGSVWVENFAGNSVTRIDPKTNATTTVKVGQAPYDVTYLAGAAWVTNYADGTVTRIDAATNKTRTFETGSQPVGVAPVDGAVWVTDKIDETIARIDVQTRLVRPHKVGPQPAWTAWGRHQLWISATNEVEKVDLATGRVTRKVGFDAQPNDGDIADGIVWLPDNLGELHALDADTGRRLGHWSLGLTNPFVVAAYRGLVWAVDFGGRRVVAVDASALL